MCADQLDGALPELPRRHAIGVAGLGVAALVLPTALAAASNGADPEPEAAEPIAFPPRVDFVNAGTLSAPTVQVHFAWAEGYTVNQFGPQVVRGTTGAEEPFSYTFASVDANDNALEASGLSDGGKEDLTQGTKIGTSAVLTLTSVNVPSDVRTFTRVR